MRAAWISLASAWRSAGVRPERSTRNSVDANRAAIRLNSAASGVAAARLADVRFDMIRAKRIAAVFTICSLMSLKAADLAFSLSFLRENARSAAFKLTREHMVKTAAFSLSFLSASTNNHRGSAWGQAESMSYQFEIRFPSDWNAITTIENIAKLF